MAQYKVIQDIEAEDKLVGPLTLRQFIYAGVSAVCLYICFLAFSKGASFLLVFFLPLAAASGFFAFPWRGEQPTEIWALARVRFSIKPRVRIWDQDGVKNMVTVIAPKQIQVRRSSKADMSQVEVRSRLKALADTIDSRGWATRNAAFGLYNQQWNHPTVAPAIDAPNSLEATIPSDDMFDDQSSVSQNFNAMLSRSQTQNRERAIQQMNQAQNPIVAATQQAPMYAQPIAQQPAYGYSMPQLPSPILPQQPTMVQPQPDPATMAAHQPQAYQQPAYQQQAQAMPVLPAPMAAPIVVPDIEQATMQQQPAGDDYWFASGPAYPVDPSPQAMPIANQPQPEGYHIESDMPLAAAATPTNEEAQMGQAIKEQNQSAMAINYAHMRVLQPAADPYAAVNGATNYQTDQAMAPIYSDQANTTTAAQMAPQPPVTRQPDPAILELANNDDLDIATIARQAKREIDKSPDEVEIRLH